VRGSSRRIEQLGRSLEKKARSIGHAPERTIVVNLDDRGFGKSPRFPGARLTTQPVGARAGMRMRGMDGMQLSLKPANAVQREA